MFAGRRYFRKAAELGSLASAFDLVSDGLRYEASAVSRFRLLAAHVLQCDAAEALLQLLSQKMHGALRVDGLSRGSDATQIILKHFGCESRLFELSEGVEEIGVLLQIVDDVLDRKQDARKGHANFMNSVAARDHLASLLKWDYRETFKESQYPLCLMAAIRLSKARAARLVGDWPNPTIAKSRVPARLLKGRRTVGVRP